MKKKTNDLQALRKKTEEKLRAQEGSLKDLSSLDIQHLVHELGTYQIELEMQNEELRHVQEELEASRSKYAVLYDYAPVSYFTLDKNRLILDANLTGAELLGIERSRLIKKPFSRFIEKDYQDAFYLHCKKVFDSSERQSCEMKIRKKDGAEFYAIMESIQVEDQPDNKSCRTSLIDITRQKFADNAIRENEERMYLAMKASNLGLFDLNLKTGEVEINAGYAIMLGYDPADFHETVAKFMERLHPDDMEHFAAVYKAYINGELPEYKVELRLRTKDGSWKWIQSLGSITERDADGSPLRMLGTHTDITERKRMAEMLQNSLTRQKALLAAIPDIIMEVDINKIYTWANQPGLNFFGEDVIGKEASFYFEGDQNTYDIVLPIFQGSENVVYIESWQRRKDGQKRLLAWWCRALKDDKGNVTGALSSARDITEHRQAHEKARKSEAMLSKAQEIAHLGNWEWDLQTNRITWSDELYRIYDLEHMKGRLTYDILMERVHPDDRDYHDKLTGDWLKNCGGAPFEYRIVRSDGSMRHVYGPGEVECDDTGKPVRMFGIVQDVTERVKAEEDLKRSEEILRLAQEVAQVGSWAWDIRTDELTWSKEVYDMFGIDSGNKPSYQEFLATLHAEDSASVINAINAAVSRHEDFNIEYRIIRIDRTIRHVHARGKAFYDSEGNPVRMLGLIFDISERKKSEILLQQSEERYRLITESITDYIYTVSLKDGWPVETIHGDTCIGVTGYSSQEFAADPYLWIRMVVAEDHDLVRKQIDQLLSGHHTEPIEHRIVRKDGSLRWVESALIPSRDRQGNPVSYYGIIRDITEHKKMEKELIVIEDRERCRIGHDLHDGLGQLLTGLAFKIRSLGRKLEQGHFEGAAEAADISVLIDEAKEQVSYLSRGLSPLVIENEGLTVTLNALCYYTNKIFGTHCYFKCKEPVLVNNKTALTQLYRITQEAVANAAKHAKSNRVDISLTKEHDTIIITVKDDGIGIPEDIFNSGGMGLKIMKYRAGIINASLDIKQDIGGGTIVTCVYSDAKESISN